MRPFGSEGSEVAAVSEAACERVRIDGGIVVGIDNSTSSLPVLSAAADEVRLRGEELHVVHAWSIRTAARPADCPPGAVPGLDQYQREVHAEIEQLVSSRLGEEPGFAVHIHAVHSAPARVLLTASRSASLLVLGYPARTNFAGLVRGVLTEQCVRHASCSVLIARHAQE